MKKALSLLLALMLLLTLCACGNDDPSTEPETNPSTENTTAETKDTTPSTEAPTECTHDYTEAVTKEATCAEEGVKTFTCSKCGDSYTESIAKIDHSYTEAITKEATCAEEGVKTYTCAGCGDSYTESIAKVDHNWKNATCTAPKTCTSCGATEGSAAVHKWKNATCTAPKTCTTCGATEGEKLAHSYTSEVTKKATCKEEGVKPYTCAGCGDSYTESIAKVAHSWKNATCTAPKTCTSCGATEGSAAVHKWKNATCTAPKTCTTCGATEGEKLAHSYTSEVTKKATCKEEGVKTYTCAGCGDSYTESITKVAHNWKNATCTAPKTCTSCGATEGKKAAHSYTSEVTKKATCKEEGVKTYTCAGCGDSYTESIAKASHTWKDATCTAPKVCSVCRTTEGERAAHNYVNGTCSGCGNIPTIDSATVDALLHKSWTGYVPVGNGSQYVALEFVAVEYGSVKEYYLFIAYFDPLEYETEAELQEILSSGIYKGSELHWLKQFNGTYYHSFGGGGGFSYEKEIDGNILYIKIVEFEDGGTFVFNVLSNTQIVLKETYGSILSVDDIADYEGVIFTIGSVGD